MDKPQLFWVALSCAKLESAVFFILLTILLILCSNSELDYGLFHQPFYFREYLRKLPFDSSSPLLFSSHTLFRSLPLPRPHTRAYLTFPFSWSHLSRRCRAKRRISFSFSLAFSLIMSLTHAIWQVHFFSFSYFFQTLFLPRGNVGSVWVGSLCSCEVSRGEQEKHRPSHVEKLK